MSRVAMEQMSLRERVLGSVRSSVSEIALIALLGLAVLGSGLYVVARSSEAEAPPIRHEVVEEAQPEPSPEARVLLVHVAGEVDAPGVYELKEGDRVQDAILAAGGPTEAADTGILNLAAPVGDGQKVLVPKPGEALPAEVAPVAASAPGGVVIGGAVNLNTATQAQLESLPGVGPVKAGRIIAHRQTNGPFTSPRQIMEVSGFGPKTYESLKDLITV